ncbi:hypothetical protein [Streptomyces sp. NPDC058739]|uniref:hypothetical protein n=1 Tax=Streptomyces sp. NPDC058739 TaxID=3346618 RepID=UPI0036759A60
MTRSPGPSPVATDLLSAVPWSGWAEDHTAALIGVPLRIAVIVGVLALVHWVARRAITRAVQRILEPAEGESGGRAGRGVERPCCTGTPPGSASGASSGHARSARC